MEDFDSIKKQYDFNKTEPEVIIDLVEDANKKGTNIRANNQRISERANEILKLLSKDQQIIFNENDAPQTSFIDCTSIGIDGSFFPIGGVGGEWYIPYAIVRILFEGGINQDPIVDVYAAGIDQIKEQDHINVGGEASNRMLIGETKALDDWASKNDKSLVFIDGPIVDPPAYNDGEYIEYRSTAIRNCLRHSKLIGCVKRSRDTFFVKEYEKILDMPGLINNDFPSDQHLFSYFFTKYRFENNYKGFIFSNVLDISNYGTNQFYKLFGVNVSAIFFQKSIESKILRLDIPFLSVDIDNIVQLSAEAAKASSDWQYPHQYIPLPVELAHEKCRIREGAAETIYDEILTRSRSGSPENIMTMLQLR